MQRVNYMLLVMSKLEKTALPVTFTRKLIGERLRLVRVAVGLNQIELCRAIGLGASMYNQWEKGTKIPNIADLIRFCQFTGATTDYIFCGDMRGLPLDLVRSIGGAPKNRETA